MSSVRIVHEPADKVRDIYTWSKSAKAEVKKILAKYPKDQSRSAVIPLLHLAQREFDGWLPTKLMNLVAETLDMPYIRVYEVATFYTMFNLAPVGKYHVQVCTNCACMIRGSDKILEAVEKLTGAKAGESSADEMFTVSEVECLGACVNAPMMQVNDHYYTDLDAESAKEVLTALKEGKTPKVGSQVKEAS